jgi:hypothetical protein
MVESLAGRAGKSAMNPVVANMLEGMQGVGV